MGLGAMSSSTITNYAGLLIGLAYGAVGLLSGFCLLSSLRGWWAQGDSRLIRTYALAIGVAIAATQLMAAGGFVDLGKSIYLQPSFSAPLMFAGGLLFGYGMVLSNGCGSRALVLLGRGNLRSLVVVIVLGIVAQMTLKGLIAPSRIAVLQATQTTPSVISLPALLSAFGISETFARMLAASAVSGALIIFAFAHAPFQRAWGQIAAGVVGRASGRGRMVRHRLSRRRRFQSDAGDFAHLHRADRGHAAVCDAVDGADAEFRHHDGRRRIRRQPGYGAGHAPVSLGRFYLAGPHAALGRRGGVNGRGRRDGLRLLDRTRPHRYCPRWRWLRSLRSRESFSGTALGLRGVLRVPPLVTPGARSGSLT